MLGGGVGFNVIASGGSARQAVTPMTPSDRLQSRSKSAGIMVPFGCRAEQERVAGRRGALDGPALMWALLLVLAWCCGCGGKVSAAARATWYEARTRRFSVVTDGDPDQARTLAHDLERFRAILLKTTTFEERPASPPLRVFMTEKYSRYAALGGPRGYIGGFHGTIRGDFALVALGAHLCKSYRTHGALRSCPSAAAASDTEEARAILFLGYVFSVQAQAGTGMPSWYAEGLAEYMAATQFREDGTYTLGCPHSALMEWMGRQNWIPMERLMQAEAIVAVPGRYRNARGQAWAAVHYFSKNGERATQLARYLSLRSAGTAYEQAVLEAFDMTPDELNTVIYDYAVQGRFDCLSVEGRPDVVPEPTVQRLPDAEAHLQIAELLLSMAGPGEEVFDLLEAAKRLAPTDARVAAALARAHWDHAQQLREDGESPGERDAAELASTHVDKALTFVKEAHRLASGDDSGRAVAALVWADILAGQAAAQVARGEAAGSETLSEARKAYRRAIELDDALAEAYLGLGLTYLAQDNGSKEPIVALEAASYLAPRAARVSIALARLRMARGQYSMALAPLHYVIAMGAHSDQYDTATELLEKALNSADATGHSGGASPGTAP